jgi:hypothetical protein
MDVSVDSPKSFLASLPLTRQDHRATIQFLTKTGQMCSDIRQGEYMMFSRPDN